ncbi:hypothetical protein [Pseudomonas sp. SO81]|uniref:hypothetical protein n=1 Tax=Pseudomonas sp. SO81 TaxID=2983246 RepID=UPI0025A44A07|nr:hypothetical protein [Pseudomonas sp. SO81]
MSFMENGCRTGDRKTGARIIAEIAQALIKNNSRRDKAPKKCELHFNGTNSVHKIAQKIDTGRAAPDFQASNPFRGTGMQFAPL